MCRAGGDYVLSGTMIWLLGFLGFGLSLTIWSVVGLCRAIAERLGRRRAHDPAHAVELGDVAVLIPAHNEASVIADTIAAIAELAPLSNVYVVSDGSTDETAELARAAGANVLENKVGGGKAKALLSGIQHFGLLDRYRAVLFLDADTRLDTGYFDAALPHFSDPEVACVAGYATTMWRPRQVSWVGRVLMAHRERVYVITQLFVKYGQTSRRLNVTPIVPGFASTYRSRVLRSIDIAAPNLVIEDFNMTFDVHHRNLGLVAFTPAAKAYTQDPHRLGDYTRQVRRWALGFWQTVRHHGTWPGKFWAALCLTIFELVVGSLVLPAAALVAAVLLVGDVASGAALSFGPFAAVHDAVDFVDYQHLFIGVAVPDYLLTAVAAAVQRRPRYLVYGLFFLPLRAIDAYATLSSIPRAWTVRSTGRWTSPERLASARPTDASGTAPVIDVPA